MKREERSFELNGLLGANQRSLIMLAESLNKAFAPKLKAEFRGERVKVEIDGKAIWLNRDFTITGESVTPA